MKGIFTLFILILFDYYPIALTQQNVEDNAHESHCDSKMEAYRLCVKKGVSIRTLTKDERHELTDGITQCFLNEKCQNPFPTQEYLNATRNCYYRTRNESRRELQACVRRDISGFILPQDEAQGIEQMQLAVSLLAAARNPNTCPLLANRNRLAECIQNKAATFEKSANQKVDPCKVKQNCDSLLSVECKNSWNDKSVPSLCRCINNNGGGMSDRYKQEYINCVKDKGFILIANDPTQSLMENNIKAWCPKSDVKDTCLEVTLSTASATSITSDPLNPPDKLPHTLGHGNGGEETTTADESESSGVTDTIDIITTVSTETSTSTTTERTTSATMISNQNFFNALAGDPFIQNLISNAPGLKLLTNLFIGKTDLSAIFPVSNLLGDFQIGLTNIFSNKLG